MLSEAQIQLFQKQDSKILIVSDAPLRETIAKELDKMLNEAGILSHECLHVPLLPRPLVFPEAQKVFLKCTEKYKLPGKLLEARREELQAIINVCKPNVILCITSVYYQEAALWALTGLSKVEDYRSSILESTLVVGRKVIPTYCPNDILRRWDLRYIAVQDLRRAFTESFFPEIRFPPYKFIVRPSFDKVMEVLGNFMRMAGESGAWRPVVPYGAKTNEPGTTLAARIDAPITPHNAPEQSAPLILAGDIETARGLITCFGIAWSKDDAICIPFASTERDEGYWTDEEELQIVLKLQQLFHHPNIRWVFQNAAYDYQYFTTNWGFIPNLWMDTMLAQHTCFSGMKKSLNFQSSLYCAFHRYWKDEGRKYHESIKSTNDEDNYWIYNCKDCIATYEIVPVHLNNIRTLQQEEQYNFQMMQAASALRMMLRGVLIDQKRKDQLAMELLEAKTAREQWMLEVLGTVLNPRSPKQMQQFFYEELGLPVQKNKKTKRPSTDDAALSALAEIEPLLRSVCNVISEVRSIGVFLSTFVKARLSADGRARSSYNIAGTETFRWSSSKDAFGEGLNLQNIPKGNK